MESTSLKETEGNCVLCCQDLDIYALGKCDHPVCYRCSTKMRVLCEQKYCAVCREELDKVIFVNSLEPFSTLPLHQFQCEKKHDIYFTDAKIYAQFRRLLLPECPHCPEPKVFSKFEELEQHMRKQHELFCCKLCTKHLKIFSHERKWYNRRDLARHRTQGDPDDTSHRGHPLCKFCDDRYLDNDELLKHLRRDHYFCHFCDADGAQEYYSDYQYLSEHFRESHYLCEEGRCASEQFTHAFRTEIDYKAHKASAHSKNRAEARQNRHIDLQFTYAPRQQRRNEGLVSGEDYEDVRQGRAGRGRLQGHQQNTRGSWRYNREEEDREVAAALRASMAVRRQDRADRGDRQDRQDRADRGDRQDRQDRQEDRGSMPERSAPKHRKEERMEPDDTRHRTGPVKPPTEPPVRTMRSSSPQDDFPALGNMAPTPIPSLKQSAPAMAPAPAALKEDDFPSLSAAKVSSPMTGAYAAQPRKHSSFHDEDFPALVSKMRPPKQSGGSSSAWAHASSKPGSHQTPVSRAQPPPAIDPPLPPPAGLQPLSSSSSSAHRKKKGGANGENARPKPPRPPPSADDDGGGGGGTMTRQEFRAVPTMLDISSLLTVKGPPPCKPPPSKPPPSNPPPPTPATNPSPAPKAAKKKKQQQQQQQATPTPPPPSSGSAVPMETVSRVAAAAQKENVPESRLADFPALKPSAAATAAGKTSGLANGYVEKPLSVSKPVSKPTVSKTTVSKTTVSKPSVAAAPQPPSAPTPVKEEEEDFPALISKEPPPGFKSSFPLKSSVSQTALPPPPPGLGSVASKPPPGSGLGSVVNKPPPGSGLGSLGSKPPPGFTGIPLNSNVAEPEPPAPARPPPLPGTYLVPENFQQRNIELIQSIKNFLHNDESHFNQFKNYSGQFRQGLMSAAQYHCSCKDLLGENFGRIFNELLVLLPDTAKQQELLSAHADSRALERQAAAGGGGGKARKNKKSAWQTPGSAATANASAAELDCQVCPTCRQVLAPKDFNSHKTLHLGENEEFPSLQAISRIIS